MIKFFKFLLDLLIPRMVTENVAFIENGKGELIQICREIDLLPHEKFDAILPVRSFNFLGFGLFPKILDQDPIDAD